MVYKELRKRYAVRGPRKLLCLGTGTKGDARARTGSTELRAEAAKYAGTEIDDLPLVLPRGSSDFNSRARIVVGARTHKFRARQTRSRAPEVYPIVPFLLFPI